MCKCVAAMTGKKKIKGYPPLFGLPRDESSSDDENCSKQAKVVPPPSPDVTGDFDLAFELQQEERNT